jgi:hypothetical protein
VVKILGLRFCRRRKMNLIILLSIPAVIMTIIGIYALVSEKKDKKADTPETPA